jgi:hypothetical protein
MSSPRIAFLIGFTLVAVLGADAPRADEGVDLTCAWRSFARRASVVRATPTLRVRGAVNVVCDGSPGPRLVKLAIYASPDGAVPPGATPAASKFVRPRPGRTVRVAFDAPIPFGPAARYLVARVDDADEAAERDETNNLGVAGPLSTGEEYAPLDVGNQWRFAATATPPRGSPVEYDTSLAVTGEHVVDGGVVARSVTSSDSRDGASMEEYYTRDDAGVLIWGNDDASDFISPHIVPYRAFLFPFAAPYDYRAVSRRGIPYPEDVDGDGRVERMTAVQRAHFYGLEDVDLPVGRFTDCAHVRILASAVLVLTRSGRQIRVVATQHQWLAPGIGPVRILENTSGAGLRWRAEETLTGAATTAGGCGLVDGLTFATAASPFGDESAPALASDGSTALVVAERAAWQGEPHGLIAVALSSTGRALREFQVADVPADGSGPSTPSVAYGAGEFVVAWRRAGEPLHLRAATADGAFPWGAASVDLPIETGVEGAFRVAFDGAAFVVLAEGWTGDPPGQSVVAWRIGPDGVVLGSTRLADAFATDGGVAVAWDGASALCAWSTDAELRAVRVSSSGDVLDEPPIRIASGAGVKTNPTLAPMPGGGWLLAWTQSSSGAPTRVRRCVVSAAGAATPSDGTPVDSTSSADAAPAIALDGAEFVLAFRSQGADGIRAVRLTAAGDPVQQAESGFGAMLATPEVFEQFSAPAVAQVGNRAFVAWRRRSIGTPSVAGAIAFPRREELRSLPR